MEGTAEGAQAVKAVFSWGAAAGEAGALDATDGEGVAVVVEICVGVVMVAAVVRAADGAALDEAAVADGTALAMLAEGEAVAALAVVWGAEMGEEAGAGGAAGGGRGEEAVVAGLGVGAWGMVEVALAILEKEVVALGVKGSGMVVQVMGVGAVVEEEMEVVALGVKGPEMVVQVMWVGALVAMVMEVGAVV